MIDELLEKNNLTFDDLTPDERDTLFSWQEALSKNVLSLESVRDYIQSMKASVEDELSNYNDAPSTWVGILTLLIPMYGMIKHWYADQKRMQLNARLKNYVLLEAFLSTPEKARQQMERAVASISSKANT